MEALHGLMKINNRLKSSASKNSTSVNPLKKKKMLGAGLEYFTVKDVNRAIKQHGIVEEKKAKRKRLKALRESNL